MENIQNHWVYLLKMEKIERKEACSFLYESIISSKFYLLSLNFEKIDFEIKTKNKTTIFSN